MLDLTDEEVWLEIYKAYASREGTPKELVAAHADLGLRDFRDRFRLKDRKKDTNAH